MIEQLAILLSEADVKYKRKCSLKDISPIRIGGECELVVFPDTKEKLRNTVRLLRDFKAKYKTVGKMSNILVSDAGYSGVLVRCDALSSLEICGDDLTAECGLTLPSLAKLAAGASLSGLEEISGIPGTLGGAICSNAGAFGREISDVISSVDCLDPLSGELIRLGKNELSFSYRYSSLRESDLIILSATLSLKKTDHSVEERIEFFRNKRLLSQPAGYPSLGSTFKRPGVGIYASALIDKCGLKGYRVGGAGISEKHAGFIVNLGGASSEDYLAVAETARREVLKKYRVELSYEIELLK